MNPEQKSSGFDGRELLLGIFLLTVGTLFASAGL